MDLNYKLARCQNRLALHQCLAIVLRKEGCQGDPGDFWMYENGYPLFQGLLSANAVCWWNTSLSSATKTLEYKGYVNPGALLVGSEPCSLEILRNAWARRVLQPPQGYQIVALEEIEGCYVKPITQTQWTPLPEAVCAVVLRLSSQGKPAGIETIRESLYMVFPHVSPPSEQVLYDTLAQLSAEKKLYHTANGYFIVTPEKRRSRSLSRGGKRKTIDDSHSKSLLLSTEEAIAIVHGEMSTIRDGNITHQCIQTNLADVISGGNSSDKILYARPGKYHSIHSGRNQGGRSSFKLWSSSRRIRRSASTRTLAKHYHDTSSSTDGPHSDTSPTPKKSSLFSRIFRKSKRSQCQLQQNLNGQYPPSEWFNSKAVHLHNIGTQTLCETESILPYDTYESSLPRSATLPRRQRRCLSGDLTYMSSYASRENSPISKSATNTLPSTPIKYSSRSRDSSRKTSRLSLHKTSSIQEDNEKKEPSAAATKSEPSSEQSDSRTLVSGENSRSPSNANKKSSIQVDNSGPSSIESHRSSRTASSIGSGPSSVESHKTVIPNNSLVTPKASPSKSSPKKDLKAKLPKTVGSAMPQSSSFVLEVTTSQGNSVSSSKTNTKTTATINNVTNAGNTKIFVQNSPVRSVITFKNGQSDPNPNLVIINGTEPKSPEIELSSSSKNTNHLKDPTTNLNNSKDNANCDNAKDVQFNTMNNNRKLSLQLPSKESLSYNNLIKNLSSKFPTNSTSDSPINNSYKDFSKNCIYLSTPPSPTKTSDSFPSPGNVYIENELDQQKTLESQKVEKNLLGSEPNIYTKDKAFSKNGSIETCPSLNDLSFNFTSLAAQKILKGVSINSVDTLVELSMANGEKQNNCDVVHTDFGIF
ncbi:storkhead-box protein 1 [Harmonia axyridis]|uniref:storkhead-box protein 1 n=1 Tax=Harmonia axyridis TaxID=115357 RepID=UPI001E276397|nr:storkhead-box protein 1 [Harmonia axyridis]XP_045472059.1 storkhead-box protein 1 [Harmonia axyridis]XP_045472060.1 storkhead-box protein 1 [Harmonia axyridis]XP_045472061.1 storkhead-box protein 1 [Harmonia axyridis]XP_045472062.1 storkhead-box protein 1 [Harmonia axyridis]